jgi:hypothetical protein
VAQVTDLPEDQATATSPKGLYEIQADGEGLSVIRRGDRVRVRDFKIQAPRHNFSPDDRWLAVWGEKSQGLQLVDLSRNEIAFAFDPHKEINWVTFVAEHVIRVDFTSDAMLIPLESEVIRRVGASLARLTEQERCLYGLGGGACRATGATSSARPAPAATVKSGPRSAQ